ncbi:hypothetical protein [Streptacidiphilus sp. P02-A3a]|uniref:hypothetical protein n=1 Tax=Streptacidiphilus sp. P02-A3a TaxID=2704468 RepID=UPI001CDBA76A|nr:hypothetical protein [Streptacidiphilus sp. P02-A3a]
MTAIVCLALSAAAIVAAVLAATRGRVRAALRWVAVALVPTGLYLTGLITVFSRIGHAIGDWAADLVFDPRVWTGVGLLGGAVVLALLTGVRRQRTPKAAASAAAPTLPGTAPAAGRLPATSAPASAPAKASGKPVKSGKSGKQADDGLGDFADVEEILKRRGL